MKSKNNSFIKEKEVRLSGLQRVITFMRWVMLACS